MSAARPPEPDRAAPRPGPLAPRSAAPGLVAVVAAAMCFLAVLALGAADGAARVAGAWRGGLEGAATVRAPAGPDAAATEAQAQAALRALRGAPGVQGARRVPAEEIAEMMRPWLGAGADAALDPAPVLIEIALAPSAFDPDATQALLDAAAPGARLDDHAAWRARVERAASAFRRLAFGSVTLMGAALAAMVAAAARASLAGAAATVRTLRLLGARDRFIARVFDRPIAWRALLGGAAGAGLAALAGLAAPDFDLAQALGAEAQGAGGAAGPGGLASGQLASGQLAFWALAAAPLGAALVAWITARLSILALLQRVE